MKSFTCSAPFTLLLEHETCPQSSEDFLTQCPTIQLRESYQSWCIQFPQDACVCVCVLEPSASCYITLHPIQLARAQPLHLHGRSSSFYTLHSPRRGAMLPTRCHLWAVQGQQLVQVGSAQHMRVASGRRPRWAHVLGAFEVRWVLATKAHGRSSPK